MKRCSRLCWLQDQQADLAGDTTTQGSHQRVLMEVRFERDKNFTNRIQYKVTYSSSDPVNIYYSSSWLEWVASSTGNTLILDCSCDRAPRTSLDHGDHVGLTVSGVRGWDTEPTPRLTPSLRELLIMGGRGQVKAWFYIEVTSKDEGGEDTVTSSAAKALEISCLSESAIQ